MFFFNGNLKTEGDSTSLISVHGKGIELISFCPSVRGLYLLFRMHHTRPVSYWDVRSIYFSPTQTENLKKFKYPALIAISKSSNQKVAMKDRAVCGCKGSIIYIANYTCARRSNASVQNFNIKEASFLVLVHILLQSFLTVSVGYVLASAKAVTKHRYLE